MLLKISDKRYSIGCPYQHNKPSPLTKFFVHAKVQNSFVRIFPQTVRTGSKSIDVCKVFWTETALPFQLLVNVSINLEIKVQFPFGFDLKKRQWTSGDTQEQTYAPCCC